MSEHSLQLLERIQARLQATARRRSFIDMTFGLVVLVGILAGLWLLVTSIEAGFWLGVGARKIAFWSVIAVAVGMLGWFVLRPLLKMTGIVAGPPRTVLQPT